MEDMEQFLWWLQVIASTPTFEYWYLLHFYYTTKVYNSSEEVIEELKTKINGYTKNINIYPIVRLHTSDAINNAKRVEKYHKELGQVINNENCIPYTGAYKIVEELLIRNNIKK